MSNHVSHGSLPYPIKHARYTVLVPFLDADGDPTDPTTPDTEVSQDGGAFADAAEEVTTISGSNGMGYITFTGAELNNSLVGVVFKVASGPKHTLMTLYPRELPTLSSGTLSAGSAGGGTLGTVLAYDIQGCFIRTTGGTGGGGTGGADNQARQIATYTPSTGAFTVIPNWETTPSTDTTYDILVPDGMAAGAIKALNPTTAGRTLDVSSGGEAGVDWANIGSPTTTVNLSGTSTLALEPTTAGRKLDVTTTGEAGIDWANIGGPTSTQNLSGTTVKTATDIETDTQDIQSRLPAALVSGRIDSSVGAMAANTLTASALASSAVDEILDARTIGLKKNMSFTDFPFTMLDSSTFQPIAGRTVTATRKIDGGSFATGGLTNIQDETAGVYTIDGDASDVNGTFITFRFTATGCLDTIVHVITTP